MVVGVYSNADVSLTLEHSATLNGPGGGRSPSCPFASGAWRYMRAKGVPGPLVAVAIVTACCMLWSHHRIYKYTYFLSTLGNMGICSALWDSDAICQQTWTLVRPVPPITMGGLPGGQCYGRSAFIIVMTLFMHVGMGRFGAPCHRGEPSKCMVPYPGPVSPSNGKLVEVAGPRAPAT